FGTFRQENIAGTIQDFNLKKEGNTALYKWKRDYLGVGASLFAGVLGVEAEARPLEMIDFVTGIIGFDLRGDDF
ncbi:hypothetical protein ACFL1X_14330, partial [Candidatus Hydrogenedentota bacterium]